MISSTAETPIPPDTRVRYIKLGEGGKWEKECREKGIVRYGFGSAKAERFDLCIAGRWEELTQSFITEGKDKGTATRFTNETRIFFEDDGKILWITFMNECLYWGFLKPMRPERHSDGDGVWRTVENGWKADDLKGERLTKDKLSGALTKLAAYRGTSCNVDVSGYVIRRVNGQKTSAEEHAISAMKQMKSSVLELTQLLDFRDFEILVDLIFTTSGWRRQGAVGKTQKTLDIDLKLPSTGERAFVQVKSTTTSAELAEYIQKFNDLDQYRRMFYAYHSGEAETKDDRVVVLNPDKIADLVIDAGLVNWLIDKAK